MILKDNDEGTAIEASALNELLDGGARCTGHL
jgi:hypothetical protein